MFAFILAIIFAIAGFAATTIINAHRKSEASAYNGDGTYTKISFPLMEATFYANRKKKRTQ